MYQLPRTEDLIALSGTYTLLARIWLWEVDAPLVEQLRSKEVREVYAAVGGIVPAIDDLDDLAAEYCRLFVGPKDHLPPLQSVWERGELQGALTASVQAFAEAVDYQPDSPRPNTMIDHLGAQLDIMAVATELIAHNSADEEANSLGSEFFRRHLSWTDDFINAVKLRKPLPFYSALAEMTQIFLQDQSNAWLQT